MWTLIIATASAEDPAPVTPPAPDAPIDETPPEGLWLVSGLRTLEGAVPVRVNVPAPGAPVTTRALVVPVGDTWAALTAVIAIVPEGNGVAVRFEALALDEAIDRGNDGGFDGLIVVSPPPSLVVLEPHGLRAADRPVGAGPLDCDVALDWTGDSRPEVVVYGGAIYRRTTRGRAGWRAS